MAKAPTGSVFAERAASAAFDPTAPQIFPRVRAGKERPVYRCRHRSGELEVATAR
jgi:hypothetical protein